MANIFTNLNLTADSNFFITQKINSIGYVGENTVTRLNIEVPEITEGAVYELETENSAGVKNVALLSTDAENSTLYLDFTARMLTVNDLIMMQLRVTYTDNSIKKSNRFAMKIAKSISATDYYEEYAVTIFDQLVQDCRDIIEGAESYAVRAETAAVNAEAYEQSASASAEAATTAATTATTASTAAVNAAASAESASTSAHTSAETATTAANSASTSASTAQTSAQTAQSASVTAQSASEAAQTASTAATSAATSAENSASSATTAANNASASATAAASSASNASNSATSASTSATNAAASETNAAASASSASTSASNANTSATNAADSATSAAASATNAHNSEVNASTSETNASTSATEAAASAESIAASVAQINENTYRINDLEAIIAGYQLADLPTGAVASVTDGTALLMPSLKVGIEPVQEGSGDPSPENIRPISGWTAANVMRCGKNLYFDKIENASITSAGVFENNNSNDVLIARVNEGDTYMFSCNDSGVTVGGLFTEKPTMSSVSYNRSRLYLNQMTPYTITIPQGVKYIAIRYLKTFTTFMIEKGSTATAYEPYNGQTYTIEFRDGDNPLTVYGGTLDVTSGELVVDRKSVDMGDLNYAYDTSYNRFASNDIPNTKAPSGARITSFISSMYEVVDDSRPISQVTSGQMYSSFNSAQTNAIVMVHDNRFTDAALFRNAVSGQTFTYKLAEPITYQLTPTQIRTLVGNNNIWSDTGDIISGKYFKSLT